MGELVNLSSNHLRANPEHDTIFIDLPNAFNECSRRVAANQIVEKCPILAGLFELFYKDSSNIWLRNDSDDWEAAIAEEGCVQGCAMGPYVFGFATLPSYLKAADSLKDKANSFFRAYSDDSIIGAAHGDAIKTFDILQEGLSSCGLKVNFKPHKTVVLVGKCNSEVELQQRVLDYQRRGFHEANIKIHPLNGGSSDTYGYVHLGVPVGDMNYCTHELGKLVTQFEETCDCDLAVKSAQQKWVYLLWVIRQKFTYWFRNMSPNITKQVIDRITGILKKKFTDLANFDVTDNYWQQICLPIKHHGCGISDPLLTMHAAFVANTEETIEATKKVLHDAQYLEVMDITKDLPVDFDSMNNDIKEYVKAYRDSKNVIVEAANLLGEKIDEQRVTNLTRRKKVQHFYYEYLTAAAVKRYEDSITSNGSKHDKARTFSNDGSLSGAWLYCVPKKGELKMDNTSFRTALMLRLGVPFNDRPRNCKCKDFKVVDDHLDHILCCKQNSGEIKGRHDAIVREFKSLVNHAGYQFTDARLGELRTIYNDNYMAADGCIRGLRDKPLHIDVTIANPTGPSYLHNGNSSQIKHFAIKDKEKLKNDKYLRRCQDINTEFMPLAFEIYGSASVSVNKLIQDLASTAAERTYTPYHVLLFYWRKRISFTLQYYNAWIINQAYLKLNNCGGGNIHRDLELDNIF